MRYDLTSPIYILFAELANFEVDTDQRLNLFLKENIDPAKGISKKYILDILEQAFLDGEALSVKLERKEVVIRNCLDWIKRNREENTADAEFAAFKPETNDNVEALHLRIFNEFGFSIFDEFVKGGKSWCYDCSYAYRRMHEYDKPRLIHGDIKPGAFQVWVNDNYPDKEILTEIKTLGKVETPERKNRYDLVKKLHKKK